MDLNDNIIRKLQLLEIDESSLKPRTRDYLVQIEKYVSCKLQKRDDAYEMLRSSAFTVSDVARQINCSRTTLYNNNQLLKRYIDCSLQEFLDGHIITELGNLKTTNSLLLQRIALMETRDVELEILKHENRSLKEQLKNRQADINRLRAAIENLSKKKKNNIFEK